MKIVFTQTKDDILDLTKNSFKTNKTIKIIILVLLVVLIVNLFSSLISDRFTAKTLLGWILPIVIFIGIWVVVLWLMLKVRLKSQGNMQIMTGHREIDFLDEEIRVVTPVSKSIFQWSIITELKQTSNNYFLYMGKNQAIIVPKRAFNNDKEKAEFEKLVLSKIS